MITTAAALQNLNLKLGVAPVSYIRKVTISKKSVSYEQMSIKKRKIYCKNIHVLLRNNILDGLF